MSRKTKLTACIDFSSSTAGWKDRRACMKNAKTFNSNISKCRVTFFDFNFMQMLNE